MAADEISLGPTFFYSIKNNKQYFEAIQTIPHRLGLFLLNIFIENCDFVMGKTRQDRIRNETYREELKLQQ